jgi:hypothetical protein
MDSMLSCHLQLRRNRSSDVSALRLNVLMKLSWIFLILYFLRSLITPFYIGTRIEPYNR